MLFLLLCATKFTESSYLQKKKKKNWNNVAFIVVYGFYHLTVITYLFTLIAIFQHIFIFS